MSGEEIDVSVSVPDDDDSQNDSGETSGDVTTEHEITGAVNSEVAGQLAQDAREDAEGAAIVSELGADIATAQAESAADSAQRTEQMLNAMRELTESNVALLSAMQAQQTPTDAEILADPAGVPDPSVDVEPENTHWLRKKWFTK